MAVQLNQKGVSKANSLVRQGKIKESESWSGPSADRENSYIKENSISAYSVWFLGEDTSENRETKGRWKFPFSSDFENVDRKGIIAAKARAAQQGYGAIEKSADSILKRIDNKLAKKANAEVRCTRQGCVLEVEY